MGRKPRCLHSTGDWSPASSYPGQGGMPMSRNCPATTSFPLHLKRAPTLSCNTQTEPGAWRSREERLAQNSVFHGSSKISGAFGRLMELKKKKQLRHFKVTTKHHTETGTHTHTIFYHYFKKKKTITENVEWPEA